MDTPYPTVWQTAKKMGVSRKRTLELIKLADEIVERRSSGRRMNSRAATATGDNHCPAAFFRGQETTEDCVKWLAHNVTAHF